MPPGTGQQWPPGERDADAHWLGQAIELSRRCPPSQTAFSVGAVLVGADGSVLAEGYSRERDPADHAEEAALAKAAPQAVLAEGPPQAVLAEGPPQALLAGATLYSSLEPCLRRSSRPRPCAALIVAAGVGRVVLAWREPPLFVPGGGAAWLREHGVTVAEIPELAGPARAVNAHLLDGRAAAGS